MLTERKSERYVSFKSLVNKSNNNDTSLEGHAWTKKYLSLALKAIEAQDQFTLMILLGPNYIQSERKLAMSLNNADPLIKQTLNQLFFMHIENAIISLEKLLTDRNAMKKYETKFISPLRKQLYDQIRDEPEYKTYVFELEAENKKMDMRKNKTNKTEFDDHVLKYIYKKRDDIAQKILAFEAEQQSKKKILEDDKYQLLQDYYAFYHQYHAAYQKCMKGDILHYSTKRTEQSFLQLMDVIHCSNGEMTVLEYVSKYAYKDIVDAFHSFIKVMVIPEIKQELKKWLNDHLSLLAKQRLIDKDMLMDRYYIPSFLIYEKFINGLCTRYFDEFEPIINQEICDNYKDAEVRYDFQKFKCQIQQYNKNLVTTAKKDFSDSALLFFMNESDIQNKKNEIKSLYVSSCSAWIKKSQSKQLLDLCIDNFDKIISDIAGYREDVHTPNDWKDAKGNTLMHHAAHVLVKSPHSATMEKNNIISLLMSYGLSLGKNNYDNMNPFEYAGSMLFKATNIPVTLYKLVDWKLAGLLAIQSPVMSKLADDVKNIIMHYVNHVLTRWSFFYNTKITDSRLEDVMIIIHALEKGYHNTSDLVIMDVITELDNQHKGNSQLFSQLMASIKKHCDTNLICISTQSDHVNKPSKRVRFSDLIEVEKSKAEARIKQVEAELKHRNEAIKMTNKQSEEALRQELEIKSAENNNKMSFKG